MRVGFRSSLGSLRALQVVLVSRTATMLGSGRAHQGFEVGFGVGFGVACEVACEVALGFGASFGGGSKFWRRQQVHSHGRA